MIKKLLLRAVIICVILFSFGTASLFAVEDGFGRAREIEGRHFTIYYAPEVEVSRLIQQLNVGPLDNLMVGGNTQGGFSLDAQLADMLDTLFERVCSILDMQLYSFKGTIKICRDSNQLNYIYHQIFSNSPANVTRSFYAIVNNTIYTSPENFRLGVIGHEIAHAIISHYFVVLPSVKIQELLSAYVEYQLRTSRN